MQKDATSIIGSLITFTVGFLLATVILTKDQLGAYSYQMVATSTYMQGVYFHSTLGIDSCEDYKAHKDEGDSGGVAYKNPDGTYTDIDPCGESHTYKVVEGTVSKTKQNNAVGEGGWGTSYYSCGGSGGNAGDGGAGGDCVIKQK